MLQNAPACSRALPPGAGGRRITESSRMLQNALESSAIEAGSIAIHSRKSSTLMIAGRLRDPYTISDNCTDARSIGQLAGFRAPRAVTMRPQTPISMRCRPSRCWSILSSTAFLVCSCLLSADQCQNHYSFQY